MDGDKGAPPETKSANGPNRAFDAETFKITACASAQLNQMAFCRRVLAGGFRLFCECQDMLPLMPGALVNT